MGSGGGSTSTTTVDPVYNAGLLEIAKEDQDFKKTFMNMFQYGTAYDPNEEVWGAMVDGKWVPEDQLKNTNYSKDYMTINPEYEQYQSLLGFHMIGGMSEAEAKTKLANRGYKEPEQYIRNENALIKKTRGEMEGYDPNAQVSEMQYLQNLVESNQSLLGLQTDVSKKELNLAGQQADAMSSLLPQQTEVQKKKLGLASTFLSDIDKGINVGERMDQAQASVQHGFKNANETMRRDISSYGLDPSSGRYASQARGMELAQASGIAGARTTAKNTAEAEDFERKKTGLQLV